MEKSKLFIVIVLIVFALIDVNGKTYSNGKFPEFKMEPENQLKPDDLISRELLASIEAYIAVADTLFPKDSPVIYSAYFFEKEGKNYFSIWGNYLLPYYIESHNPTKTFDYTLFTINNKNVVLINSKDYDQPKLYKLDSAITGKDKVDKIKRKEYSYDGHSFPKTFEYYLENNEYIISEINSMYFDFLGEDFMKYGKLLKENK
ncbi:hypothetical protein [Draconibacterium sediminis]|uniref:Uncharacterized protein n=1 Tax=Draconibacterium sediminis TaxID=1544798 RepID=A0A0D8JAZ4_9BACT|nr:hypothetical protein [Draconibacterium sediminis]KJF44170.1 hypothetical protein LH29_01180 [Draconibacterium sediminis]